MRQIDKNTVSSKGQLKENQYVTFINKEGKGKRILFVGNSITRHGILHDIGWHTDWGMAASDIEKDYVHIIKSRVSEKDDDAAFCVCQASVWERSYKDDEPYKIYEPARDFDADIIIMRVIENCKAAEFEPDVFSKAYKEFISYLNKSGKAKVVLTTGFWKHPGDDSIKKVSDELGFPCIYLGNLGEDDSMKAIGLFEHAGVAAHPGDLGMLNIADRIWEEIK